MGLKYQWIKTAKSGSVVEIESETEKHGFPFLNFVGGGGIFKARLSEYMITYEGSDLEIKQNTLVQPTNQVLPTNQVQEKVVKKIEHPLMELIKTIKKKNLKLNFLSSTPSKAYYKVLAENYDEKLVMDIMIDNIYNEIVDNPEKFKEMIEQELKKIYCK